MAARQSRGPSARGVHADDPEAAVRVQARHHPHHAAAPVVAAEDGLVDLERVEHSGHVVAEVPQAVARHVVGPVGQSVAALVGGDGAEPCLGERRKLEAPGEGELGEAVAEHDGDARALLVDRHADAVRLHEAGRRHAGRRPDFGAQGDAGQGQCTGQAGRRLQEAAAGKGGEADHLISGVAL